ncbi:hypothetical protein B4096_0192 [Heyndrickxia coagulans]|nr:hypothetical protein B4096_0192 [Heyndrickxia coagulans]
MVFFARCRLAAPAKKHAGSKREEQLLQLFSNPVKMTAWAATEADKAITAS